MPASSAARPLLRTYTADAGSSPTSTTASPGSTPVDAFSAATPSATSPRTCFAISLPLMISAAMSAPSR